MKKIIILFTIISLFLFSNLPLLYAEEVSSFSITDVEVISNSDNKSTLMITSGNANFLNRGRDSFATSGESLVMSAIVEHDYSPRAKNVLFEFTTPNGIETIDALNDTSIYLRWGFTKTFTDNDIGTWTLNKIVASDGVGTTVERTFNDFTFHIFPSNYSYFNKEGLTINNNDDFVKISLSKEMDLATLTLDSVLLYESQLKCTFGNNYDPYDLKQITDYNLSISKDKKSFTLEYSSPYLTSKMYHIIVKDTIKDLDGNILTTPKWINLKYNTD